VIDFKVKRKEVRKDDNLQKRRGLEIIRDVRADRA